MTPTIPARLYRGDADRWGTRSLKPTIHHYQLQTNLVNGGNGREVYERPLVELISRHVDPGWRTTHFLSFSEDLRTAFRFGLGVDEADMPEAWDEIVPYESEDNGWDFALIDIDTTRMQLTQLDIGIYEAVYPTALRAFADGDGNFRLILIDVNAVFKNAGGSVPAGAGANASRDKQWLVFPATKKLFNNGTIEFSAILDIGPVGQFTLYKK